MSWEAWGDPPEYPCEMCGRHYDYCICEMCPECGEIGDKKCYEAHGMVETDEQVASRISYSGDYEEGGDA